jgi:hypothetical protein
MTDQAPPPYDLIRQSGKPIQSSMDSFATEQEAHAVALVIPLSVEMFDVFAQGPPQGALTEENHLAQALLLHRPDPALRIGI